MAWSDTPNPQAARPQLREPTKSEQYWQSERGQDVRRVVDYILMGDMEGATRAGNEFWKKYNITEEDFKKRQERGGFASQPSWPSPPAIPWK